MTTIDLTRNKTKKIHETRSQEEIKGEEEIPRGKRAEGDKTGGKKESEEGETMKGDKKTGDQMQ